MKAKLTRFRVTKFRSIQDSGWINASDITCLVGTNESGKTNVLLALSKLKPSSQLPIDHVLDFPRGEYQAMKGISDSVLFISAEFCLSSGSLDEHLVDPKARAKVAQPLGEDSEGGVNEEHAGSNEPRKQLGQVFTLSRNYSGRFRIDCDGEVIIHEISVQDLAKLPLWNVIPSFVYYSDYGNLDSEIHLPIVTTHIGQLSGTALTDKQRAKARTLKVLFDFLRLSPAEISQMGKENEELAKENEAHLKAEGAKKKERQILLDSGAAKLTKAFREWWKQGSYQFDFSVDGSYFRIWVSDQIRPEKIELENRSRGLQWFFSFFLVFLVESKNEHQGSILLLDEPGLTLHPNAQKDLIGFFESLSGGNQLMYTTHSPFMVDADHIGDVVAVYIAENGETKVSHDLREGNRDADKSIYPIHAAIGLTISETLLLGCTPVLVEGPSDQIILNAIKNYLIKLGRYNYDRELVFIPTGGVKGVSSVKNILLGRDGELPYVLLDSDGPGLQKEKDLKSGAYKEAQERVLGVKTFTGIEDSEIEDLLPVGEMVKAFSKRFRGRDEDFEDATLDASKPIVDQMEAFAIANGISLKLGWKVEIAKDMAKALRKSSMKVPEELVAKWEQLFNTLTQKGA